MAFDDDCCPVDISDLVDINCDPSFSGSCEYGEISCCGETYPTRILQCTSRGIWALIAVDACTDPECEQCPAEKPAEGESCFVPDDETCEYDLLTCCDDSFNATTCNCSEKGAWECNTIFVAPCPDPIDCGECPVDAPVPNVDECSLPSDQVCGYNPVDPCCGDLVDSKQCFCDDGVWQCAEIPIPSCPDPDCRPRDR